MTLVQSLYFLLLCVGLIGGAIFAFRGIRLMRASDPPVPRTYHTAVNFALAAAAAFMVASVVALLSALAAEPPVSAAWGSVLRAMSLTVIVLLVIGSTARMQTAAARGDRV